jgi:hypothetical protein
VRVSGGELKSVRVGFGWGLERIWCFLRVTRSAKFRSLKERGEDGRSLDLATSLHHI